MEKYQEKKTGVSAIANHLAVSIGRLERAFKDEFDMGPADYQRQMRMERARDLLAHSRMPVREVGLACGYASFSSFVRAFRTTYGSTPNKARRP
jgi:transcriptional regulator GlxA family with amidase domain